MTEFKRLQKSIKLTNEEAAKLFKVSERTISRWRTDKIPAPESCLIALRALAAA